MAAFVTIHGPLLERLKGALRVLLVNILILPLALILLVTGFGTVVLFALVSFAIVDGGHVKRVSHVQIRQPMETSRPTSSRKRSAWEI